MKKRVLSALLVLCMACSLVSTVWAEGTNATSGAPEPASQTLNLENEQPGDENGADSTGVPSDSTDSTSASSDSTSSSSAASDATSGEGDESAASSDSTAASDSTPSSSSASSDSSDSDADDPDAASSDVTGDESSTGTEEENDPVDEQPGASSEPVPSQPNRAPAAAPGTTANSDNDIELYAEPGAGKYTFQVTWKPDSYSSGTNDEYVQVILYDTESKNTISISGNDFDAWRNSHTQMNNGTTWNISQDHPDIDGYHFSGAEYWRTNDNNGAENAKSLNQVRANREQRGFSKRWYYYVDNGNRFEISENRLVIRLKYTPDEPEEPTPQGDFYIDDKIIQAGTLVPQFSDPNSDNAQKVVSYKWYRSDSENGSYTEVTRRKVTLDSYNVTETGDALYPSFDDGARQWYYVEAYDAEGTLLDTSPKFQVPLYDALQNGSFETPKLKGYGQRDPNPQSGEEGIVWKTTADDNEIELIHVDKDISGWWGSDPKNSDTWDVYGLYDTADGNQVAELNANSAGALYQDVLTVPGSTLTWELSHRARNRGNGDTYTGNDTMYVIIMSTVRAEDYTTQAQIERLVSQHQSELDRDNYYYDASTGIAIWKLSDGASWAEHSDTYVVPSNQHATRFFFAAGHTSFDDKFPNATNDKGEPLKSTVGNFIDDVSFDDEIPAPNDDEINLTLSKTVVGLTDEELANYKVDITVQGTGDTNTVQFNAENFIFSADESSATATRAIQIKLPANAGEQTYTITESVSGLVDDKEATSSTVAVDDGNPQEATQTTIQASGGNSYKIAFTNTYTPTTGTITIIKNIYGLTEDEVENWIMNATADERLRFDVDYFEKQEYLAKDEANATDFPEEWEEQKRDDWNLGDWTFDVQDTLDENGFNETGNWDDEVTGYDNDESINAQEKSHYTAISMEKKIGSEGENYFQYKMTLDEVGLNYWYRVWELHTDVPGYTLESTVAEYKNGGGDSSLENLLVMEDMAQGNHGGKATAFKLEENTQNVTVEFTNRYTPTTGSLTIVKEVESLPGDVNANNTLFQFTITALNTMFTGTETSRTFDAVDAKGAPAGSVTFTKGAAAATAMVTITGEGSLKINGLPLGEYTVQETSAPDIGNFYCDLPATSVSGTISNTPEANLDQTVIITNTYKPYRTLTIEKTVTGEMGSDDDVFTFTVEKVGSTLAVADVTKAADSASDSKVEIGTQLTEDGSLSFTMTAGGKVTLSKLKDTDVVTITETDPGNGYKPSVDLSGVDGYVAPGGGTSAQHPGFETVNHNGVKVIVNQVTSSDSDLGKVKFINTRTAVAPTGLESNHTTPYVLMITAAGMAGLALIGGIVARRVRRRRQE